MNQFIVMIAFEDELVVYIVLSKYLYIYCRRKHTEYYAKCKNKAF